MRVLKWIIDRVQGRGYAIESPLGWMPRYEDMDWTGQEIFSRDDFAKITTIDREPWKQELLGHEELFSKLPNLTSYKNIQNNVWELAFETERKLLISMNLFDVYSDEKIGQDKISYAISFILRDDEKERERNGAPSNGQNGHRGCVRYTHRGNGA